MMTFRGAEAVPKSADGIVSLAALSAAGPRKGPRRAALDGDARTLHIRCGSDIREALAQVGFQGDFLEVADPLIQGPVPETRSPQAYQETRAAFIAGAYGLTEAGVRARMTAEAAGLTAAQGYDRVVLWFEHDPYDQFILARVLDVLHPWRDLPLRAALVLYDPARDAGAVGRVRGLGELAPDKLKVLWGRRRAVTQTLTAQGRRVWDALRRPDPRSLARLARGPVPGLPTMPPALTRWLQDLPWTGDGLGLTERQILRTLSDAGGAASTGALFSVYLETDSQPTLGDAMFVHVILGLAGGPSPAVGRTDADGGVGRHATWVLTDTGRAVLDGGADWAALGGLDRWMGGTHLTSPAPSWRWDPQAGGPASAE